LGRAAHDAAMTVALLVHALSAPVVWRDTVPTVLA
jgi:hypothetical protein